MPSSALAKSEHDVTGDTRLRLRTLEEQAELLLAHTIDGLDLLLLAELLTVFGNFLAALVRTMLPRGIRAALKNLVRSKNRLAETTGNLGLGTCIT